MNKTASACILGRVTHYYLGTIPNGLTMLAIGTDRVRRGSRSPRRGRRGLEVRLCVAIAAKRLPAELEAGHGAVGENAAAGVDRGGHAWWPIGWIVGLLA